jgi:hypothetical protein
MELARDKCGKQSSRKDVLKKHIDRGDCRINNKILVPNTKIIKPVIYPFTEDSSPSIDYFNKILRSEHHNLIELLVVYTNLNPNTPSYHNIYYDSKTSSCIDIFNGIHWEPVPLDDSLDAIIDSKIIILEKILKKHSAEIESSNRDKINRTIKLLSSGDIKSRKSVKQRLRFKLYCGSVVVEKTRKLFDDNDFLKIFQDPPRNVKSQKYFDAIDNFENIAVFEDGDRIVYVNGNHSEINFKNPQLQVLYVVSNEKYLADNMFKIGRHTGPLQKLLTRYRTDLISPICLCFIQVNNYIDAESRLKNKLIEFRIPNDNGNLSEWVDTDLHIILKNLDEVITYDSVNCLK